MLQAYPNLKGIESPTTVGISSAAQYLSTSKYKGKIVLTGLGLPSQMKKYVHNGTVKAFALWNPEDLGSLAGYAVSRLAEGTITGKVGETFTAGKLGKYTIIKGPDGRPQVILGPPFTFTLKNVDKFNFSWGNWGRRRCGAPVLRHDRDADAHPRPRARREELRRCSRARRRRHRAVR